MCCTLSMPDKSAEMGFALLNRKYFLFVRFSVTVCFGQGSVSETAR